MKKILKILAILLAIVVALYFVKLLFFVTETLVVEESLKKTTADGQIRVDVQPIGSEIIVSSIKLTKSGFIVIETFGQPDMNIIGVSELFEPGEYRNIKIQLDTVVKGQKLVAGLWHDDGDSEFNPSIDTWQLSEQSGLRIFQFFDVKTR